MPYVTNQYGQRVWQEDYAQQADAGFGQIMSSNVALIQQADAEDAAEKARKEAEKAAEEAKKRAAEIKAKQEEAQKEAARAAEEAQRKAAEEAAKAAQERLRQQQEAANKAAEEAAQRAAEAAAKAAEQQADEAAKQAAAQAQKAAEDAARNAARLQQATAPDPDQDNPASPDYTMRRETLDPQRASVEDPSVPRYQPGPSVTAPAGEAQAPPPVSPVERAEAGRASDGQTLAQQTAWTRDAFRQRYGANAEVEWIREHERELERNRALYGSSEPQAGTAPIVGAPAGTPPAPNRVIGAVEPPRYSGPYSSATDPLTGTTPAGEAAARPGTSPVPSTSTRPQPGQSTQIAPPSSQTRPAITQPGTAPTALPVKPSSSPTLGQGQDLSTPQPSAATRPPMQVPTPGQEANTTDPLSTEGVARSVAAPTPQPPTAPPLPTGQVQIRRTAPGPGGGTVGYTTQVSQADLDAMAPDERSRWEIVPTQAPAPAAQPPRPSGQILVQDPSTNRLQSVDASRWNEFHTKGHQWIGQANPAEPTSPDEPLVVIGTQGNEQFHTTITGKDWPGAKEQGWQIVGRPTRSPDVQNMPERTVAPPAPSPYQRMPETPATSPSPNAVQPMAYKTSDIDFNATTSPRAPKTVPAPTPEVPVQPAPQSMGTVTPTDPVLQASYAPKPMSAIVQLANQGKQLSPQDQQAQERNVLAGISALLRGDREGSWAEPYLNDVARLAWSREERNSGRFSDPRDAPVEYIEKWKDAYFGSDTNVPLVKELDQQMIDYGVARSGGPNAPFDWRHAYGRYGENGLVSRQIASNDCGPNAFSVIVRSRGINLDPQQAFQFATQNRYHNGVEFNGPGAMVAMLNETGLQASAHSIDWRVIDGELAAGRPVLLSSRTHWYSITGKNQNGQYYTGATGAVVNNPEWANPGDLVYAGARPDTMVLTRGQDVSPNARVVQQFNLKPKVGDPGLNRALLSQQTTRSAAVPQPGQSTQMMSNQTPTLGTVTPNLPPILQTAKPRAGLVAGQSEPADQMGRVWQLANQSTGDKGFADGLSALLIGEGGMRGGVGDQGRSFGPYQFYWGGGEGNGFEAWLRQTKGFRGSTAEAQQLAKDVDLASEYYLPRVKQFYDRGTAMGYQNPVQAIAAGGHNSGAPRDPRVWQHYADAWDNWQKGNVEQQDTVQSTSMYKAGGEYPTPDPPHVTGSGMEELPDIRYPGEFPYQETSPEGMDRSNDSLFAPPGPFVPSENDITNLPPGSMMRNQTTTSDIDFSPRYNYRSHMRDPRLAFRASLNGSMPVSDVPLGQGQDASGTPDASAPGGLPNLGTLTPNPPEQPQWMQEANPDAGIIAGQGRGRDTGAQVWQTAYEMSGDAKFATLVGGLVNGEGGFSGKQDEVGATGIFQFDPRFAEGKEFAKWLKANGIDENPVEAAKNVKYAMGYYLPYLKDAYDDARAKGVTDDVGLMRAIVTGPSRRGYGHNSGSSGANFQNYVRGLEEFQRGEFRLLPRDMW